MTLTSATTPVVITGSILNSGTRFQFKFVSPRPFGSSASATVTFEIPI
jgi:hypothetical protein